MALSWKGTRDLVTLASRASPLASGLDRNFDSFYGGVQY